MKLKITLTISLFSLLISGCSNFSHIAPKKVEIEDIGREQTFAYFIDDSFNKNKKKIKKRTLKIKKVGRTKEDDFLNTVNKVILETSDIDVKNNNKNQTNIETNIVLIKEQQSPNKHYEKLVIKKDNVINKKNMEIVDIENKIKDIKKEQKNILISNVENQKNDNLNLVDSKINKIKKKINKNNLDIDILKKSIKRLDDKNLNIENKKLKNDIKIKTDDNLKLLKELKNKEEEKKKILNKTEKVLNKILNDFNTKNNLKEQEKLIEEKKKELIIKDFKNKLSKKDKDFEEMKIKILELQKKQNLLQNEIILVKNSTIRNRKDINILTKEQQKLKKIYLDLTYRELNNFDNEINSIKRETEKEKEKKFIQVGDKKIYTKKDQEIITDLLLKILSTNRPLYFQLNEYSLDVEQYKLLAKLSKLMLKMDKTKSFKILLEGHTDGTGSSKINKKLSLDRAKSVQNVLIKYGIPRTWIEIKGYGSNKPICNEKTLECYQLNRRTEIKIVEIK